MSQPHQPYEPLPLTNDDHIGHALYNAPHDPTPSSPYHTPQYSTHDLPDDDLGNPQPRFMGPALYSEGGQGIRHSYASSHQSFPSQDQHSQYNSSVYNLNESSGAVPLSQYGTYRDDPHDPHLSRGGDVPMGPMGASPRLLNEKRAMYAAPRSKRKVIIWAIVVAGILLIAAVLVPLYFAVIKPNSHSKTSSSTGSAGGTNSPNGTTTPTKALAVTGGDGSEVTLEDGTTFTYSNSFGGTWYWDENDPFNNGARAQSWSPALNETFNYGVDKIRGVNIGGWLTLEPFMQAIAPAMYEPYQTGSPQAVDEWTLHTRLAADTAKGGISQLETHYQTFITEQDFAEIAAAGLNYVRIPLPYWAIEVRGTEPFLPKVCWTYFLKGIKWARKYGLRINLDFHALPGSQNGWNHSGRLGTINMLNGSMGLANAQRSLDYIRVLAEFISQPQYRDVITMFGITNEPQGYSTIGHDVLSSFYFQAYQVVRNASGIGAGNGPFISIHDGFFSRDSWNGVLGNADRVAIDTHPYLGFQDQSTRQMADYANVPCTTWGAAVNASMGGFGLTTAGEWSNGVNDCGLWLTGPDQGTRYEGTYYIGTWPRIGSCTPWTDYQNWDDPMKQSIKTFALATMDALQNWFFWTWKIGNSSISGKVESPAWSYSLGLAEGWMPKDPRDALGQCGNTNPWNGPLQSWQTGGAGAGVIAASVTQALPWPPAAISNAGSVDLLPKYTPTGAIPTLTGPTFTSTPTANPGTGWQNPADNAGMMVEIPGCTYLDAWTGNAGPPSPLCT
ncbi:exo-beta-1,3-glucanase [Mycena floridula]|nr:exo-beta-1,3-glucanase [Mycena floridula]